MIVSYSLTRSDVFKGSMLREYRRPIGLIFSFVPGIAYAFYVAPEGFARFSPALVLLVLLALCIGITAFIWPVTILIGAIVTSRQAGLERGILGKHTLALAPEGIREGTEHDQTTRSWQSLLSVQSSRLGVMLVMAGGTYYYLPSRAFESRSSQDTFAKFAREAAAAG
jgi:hypothetical protein